MAKKEAQIEEDIIDLTELIESGDKGDGTPSRPGAPIPDEDDDDFAAILAETAGGAPHAVDPDEKLDMSGMGGMDTLLESLDIPSQEKTPAKAPAEDDLDSALDDLLGEEAPAPKADAKTEANLDADLDMLLDEMAPAPKEPPKAAAKEKPGIDDDLDMLLDEGAAPKAAPRPAAKKKPDIDDDLDLLLDEAPAAKPAPEAKAGPAAAPGAEKPAKSAAMTELDADLDDILSSFDEPAAPEPKATPKSPEPEIAADIDDILGEVEPQTPPKTAPRSSEPARAEPESDVMEGVFASAEEPESGLPAKTGPEKSENAPPGNEAALVPSPSLSPEMIMGLCRNIASSQEGSQQALQDFSRELGEQSAHVEDMGAQIAALGKRLLACESKLSAARARIASLEKAMESTAALEDLLKEGTPLHSGFLTLISAAVSNALQGVAMPGADPALENRLDKIGADFDSLKERLNLAENRLDETAEAKMEAAPERDEDMARLIANNENAEARLRALENKLGSLESRFGAEMEKTVAGTVAKVLHEEISRLAQG